MSGNESNIEDPDIDLENNVLFKTKINLKNVDFTELTIFIKFPQSTRKQKVIFISSDDKNVVRIQEKFSAIFKHVLKPEMFVNNSLEINTIVNIDSFYFNFLFSDAEYPLSPELVEENEHLKNFLFLDQSHLLSNDDTEFISNNLVKNANSLFGAVKSIINWVNNVLFYDYEESISYKSINEILAKHKGTCVEFVHLCLVLLRDAEIPSRAVQGLVRMDNEWKTHTWIEYYDPIYLWIPIDVTIKPPNIGLDENYIKIFTSEDCFAPYYAVNMNGERDFNKEDILIENSIFIDGSKVDLSPINH